MDPISGLATPLTTQKTAPQESDGALWDAAKELEASFLSEMLKSAGIGKTPDSFGGGIGEDQFASFLRQEQARTMVDSGGIGLAQSLFEALKEQSDVSR
ncbi:Rod binding protein [Aliiroseovarius halocynthiae]|uniref:Chemotaxis protein chel n=1 Tax=Aliiroseovarius halocynthiae TaxID=985055 RepID=A0A545SLV1_9RHOB|nr:rod-binding protein [Aliiroseovarius halocynthiae]TQV65953.1 chemotaxis protein chel [Aliiroseovarius halocynthiae]SMR83461.1 Rod binding protein [Aliiroseovarius halocynthiae]